MDGNKKRFSIGRKMYVFVICVVLAAAFGTAALSYFISADQIDRYFKRLAYNSARNFASFIDAEYCARLREHIESDEFQALRDTAEEEDDEEAIKSYLTEHDLWEGYSDIRERLSTYLSNMYDLKYLYIIVIGDKDAVKDMYLIDDYEQPLYETGYYEDREEGLLGKDIANSDDSYISNGDWGWLCSAYAPVRTPDGKTVCSVGCDVSMEGIMEERAQLIAYVSVAVILLTIIVLAVAILFVNRVIVNPLNKLTAEMKKFKPAEGVDYHEAGVVDIDIGSKDEINDIYMTVRTMQTNIIDYINDLSVMQRDNMKYKSSLRKAKSDIRSKDEQIGQISREAYRDALTGLGNKTAYIKKSDELNQEIESKNVEFGIVVADLNDLKQINDKYGHRAGDAYILGSGKVLCEAFKHSPVFRIGGDEFVVILRGRDYQNRHSLIEHVRSSFAESCRDESVEPCERYSAAVGMAEYASDDSTVELVFKRADKAMYEDKKLYKSKNGSYR
ncbi:MAG: sensor domain-containing diguanylate cyclase [Ruminiclostridium sp.]|nr:sensor domain-containing diguanylate cyclase [Ruminiclostridium sp.]